MEHAGISKGTAGICWPNTEDSQRNKTHSCLQLLERLSLLGTAGTRGLWPQMVIAKAPNSGYLNYLPPLSAIAFPLLAFLLSTSGCRVATALASVSDELGAPQRPCDLTWFLTSTYISQSEMYILCRNPFQSMLPTHANRNMLHRKFARPVGMEWRFKIMLLQRFVIHEIL